MKKQFFTLVAIFIGLGTQAQDKTKFGVFAGPQATSAYYKIGSSKQSTSYKYGFQAGANFKIAFDNQLYFVPTAAYSLKGYNVDLTRPSYPPHQDAINNDVRLHTFELGALLQYDLGKKSDHFFIKAGPTLDFQLKGKEKFDLNDGSSKDRDMVFGFGDYGRYAASFLFQLGYETRSGWFLYGQYTHGVGSFNNADHGPSITHRGLGFSVGHYLKK